VSHFFLSHARADADPYLETFLNDFREELRGAIGATSVEGLAFRDTEDIPLGAPWEPALARALLGCRTFFAMLSPTYLKRPACNKEWAGFEWRLEQHGGAAAPDLLLPLVWIPIPDSDLPQAVRQRQYMHAALGQTYKDKGLRVMVRRAGAEYYDLLTTLAAHVRDLLRQPALPSPPGLPPPDQLPDPFGIEQPAPATASPAASGAGATATGASAGGPKHVQFIVVAAPGNELGAVRRALNAYGAAFDDWCPYQPVQADRVGLLVQKIAYAESLTTGLNPVAQDIVAQVKRARDSNTLVVLVVDVWSLLLPSYRSYMRLFDAAERLANAGVLVVWNLADVETIESKQRLADALDRSFFHLTSMEAPLAFHRQVETPDDLTEKLRATLHTLRRRIILFGEVIRKAEGTVPIAKPLLTVPGAAP
jgi:FxsC-like protein